MLAELAYSKTQSGLNLGRLCNVTSPLQLNKTLLKLAGTVDCSFGACQLGARNFDRLGDTASQSMLATIDHRQNNASAREDGHRADDFGNRPADEAGNYADQGKHH